MHFMTFVCWWIGSVSDCYILHAFSLESNLLPFDASVKLDVILDSDIEGSEEDVHLGELDNVFNAPV